MTVKYHESGIWIEKTGENYRIGLSEKGQDDIGEVMFVELPEYGTKLEAGDVLLGVEGAKAVTELTIPVAGEVKAIHEEVEDEPELLNSPDKNKNWIIEVSGVDQAVIDTFANDPWESKK
ncbi:glycine cleavage system protein H [Marinilactibacillus psychrotolerans]|uniref:Glycine cleavage system protein H n=1 Tax=Marinilactibacillus psychrotolerans TaxID=191770 RepID=A0ABW8UPQ7_9LACT|nr:glycine cleavage system protein H [Marinilactibacillus psychrotolerans]